MTTAKQVFESAMGLMDELDPDTGSADTADTREYRLRTLHILSVLCGELYPFSDGCAVTDPGKRPVCPVPESLDDAVPLDDFLTRSILPYGLAAHLLVDENPAAAAFFQQRYQELLTRYGAATPAVSEPIADLYGGIRPPSASG